MERSQNLYQRWVVNGNKSSIQFSKQPPDRYKFIKKNSMKRLLTLALCCFLPISASATDNPQVQLSTSLGDITLELPLLWFEPGSK